MKTSLSRLTPHLLSVLRIVAALLFIAHGTQKLLGFPPGPPRLQLALSLMGAAGVIETVGGALMLLGLFTRPVAFILSGQMAVAYFMRHAPARHVSDSERRRAGRAVLLSLAVLCRRRPGSVEHR